MGEVYIASADDLTAVADAIRARSETGDALAFPGGFVTAIQNIKAGGLELNFEVVGGTTQPISPKENTIWVNTETKISGWFFGVDEPSVLTEGVVWIRLTENNAVCMDALKGDNNRILLYLNPAKQAESGAWVSKSAFIYQNGSWKTLEPEMLLYENGTAYVTLSGASGGGEGTVKVEVQESVLYIKAAYSSGSKGKYASFYTTEPVDISGYKTLSAQVNISNRAQYAGLYIADTASIAKQVGNSSGHIAKSELYYGSNTTGEYTFSINLESITTTNVYMGIGVVSGGGDSTGVMTVSKIWLGS